MVNETLGFSYSFTLILLRLMMLLVGFFFLGGMYYLPRALYFSMINSLSVYIIETSTWSLSITDDLLLNTLFGGFIGGIGLAFVLIGGASSTGTNTISRVVQLKTGTPSTVTFVMIDGGILFAQGLVFGWEKALYGLIMLIVWGVGTDFILEGPSVVRTLFIITDQPERTSAELLNRLELGVTGWNAMGMFTHAQHTMLFCTLNRADVNTVKDALGVIDPNAFLVVVKGHNVSGGIVSAASAKPLEVTSETAADSEEEF